MKHAPPAQSPLFWLSPQCVHRSARIFAPAEIAVDALVEETVALRATLQLAARHTAIKVRSFGSIAAAFPPGRDGRPAAPSTSSLARHAVPS
jgi:hypothetical protein